MNVVVTGANRGLGLEFCKQLRADGHTVVGTSRGRSQALDGTGVHVEKLDVADTQSIARFADAVAERFERVDLLINNAGVNSKTAPKGQKNVRLGDLEAQGLLRMIQINAVGPLLLTQALMPVLGDGSRVVSISSWLASIAGKTSGGNYAYCASKTTLNMLMRTFAQDVAGKGITSVVMNPGWVQTDMGGARAPLTPTESVHGMLSVIDGLAPEQNGAFLQWDGTENAW
jgi:NAD(P)-dependent dehydrogenase (short-subunit alcohol dehydrogenase family)